MSHSCSSVESVTSEVAYTSSVKSLGHGDVPLQNLQVSGYKSWATMLHAEADTRLNFIERGISWAKENNYENMKQWYTFISNNSIDTILCCNLTDDKAIAKCNSFYVSIWITLILDSFDFSLHLSNKILSDYDLVSKEEGNILMLQSHDTCQLLHQYNVLSKC